MSIHTKKPVSPRICEDFATHDRINLEHTVSPVLAETPLGAIKPALHPHGAGAPICTPDGRAKREDVAMEDGYTFEGEQRRGAALGAVFGREPKRSVEIDTAKYQQYLDDPSLSEEQKEEIIMALWSIITSFVDLGFGVHPAQEACGKAAEKLDGQAKEDSNESKAIHQSVRDAFNEKSRGI